MEPLKKKEQAFYDYLSDKIRKYGYAPSIRDMMMDLNVKSTSTIHAYLTRLEKLGYIRKESGKSRTVRIDAPHQGEHRSIAHVPLLGRVQAGAPVLATEQHEGYLDIPMRGTYAPGELLALRVRGESMRDAGILDGDIVIVHQTPVAENGDIVVAMIEDEATVKVFYKENGHFRLQPRNPDFAPILADNVYLIGKVISVHRFY